MKRVGPLPSHRLALRYTSHPSSSDDFTSDSLPYSPLDSSSDLSFDDSLSDHSLSDHSLEDNIEEDIDVGVPTDVEVGTDVGVGIEIDEGIGMDVEPSREDFPDLVSVDGSLKVMQLGLDVAMQQLYDNMGEIPVDRIASIETRKRQLEADSVIASAERVGLSSYVAVLERSNTRLPLAAQEANRADRLEAESQSQNGDEGNNNNGNANRGRNGNSRNGNPNRGTRRDAPVARVCTYKDFLVRVSAMVVRVSTSGYDFPGWMLTIGCG
ncbi:hypothetical protein Tco_0876636 [Tanacetum coccineum]|uniref:Uncharacterized protein n=1 Tax=Tanacetum coccineum TaxID=301880 RepID=A0ABQ5BSW6_9ASTR